jgi:hypothetical protein
MNEQQRLWSEVIARLMMRHGLSVREADAAWEQYQLHLRAVRLGRESGRAGIENN